MGRIGRPKNTRESIWKSVLRSGPKECWLWQKAPTSEGYGLISIDCRGFYVHKLVCEEFHGPCPVGHHAMHSCNNKLCCNPDHLSWGTAAENTQDAYKDGLALSGDRHPRAKLTWEMVDAIRADHRTQTEIARAFGIGQQSVSRIKSGISWRHRPKQ